MDTIVTQSSDPLGDQALQNLLSDIEAQNVGTSTTPQPSEAEIVESIEGETDAVVETTEAPAGEATVEAAVPETTVDADAEKAAREAAKAEKKAAREAAKAAKAAADKQKREEREAAKAAKKAEREAAKPAQPPKEERKFFADRADRIAHRLGSNLGDYMILELGDAALEGEELKAKQDANFAIVRGMSIKVKNRASLLLDYCAGKTASLNNIAAVAFKLLARDGKITSGDGGNLISTLQSKNGVNSRPYSLNAARAMGNNTISLFKQMKILVESTEKQTYVANANSVLLPLVKSKLGIK